MKQIDENNLSTERFKFITETFRISENITLQ